jgi:hypothetical protein
VLQKSKVAGPRIFREKRNGKQSPIRIDAIALSKSPVSLTLGDAVPHIFTRKSRLRPLEFLILGAKRLLQHNQPITDVPPETPTIIPHQNTNSQPFGRIRTASRFCASANTPFRRYNAEAATSASLALANNV